MNAPMGELPSFTQSNFFFNFVIHVLISKVNLHEFQNSQRQRQNNISQYTKMYSVLSRCSFGLVTVRLITTTTVIHRYIYFISNESC